VAEACEETRQRPGPAGEVTPQQLGHAAVPQQLGHAGDETAQPPGRAAEAAPRRLRHASDETRQQPGHAGEAAPQRTAGASGEATQQFADAGDKAAPPESAAHSSKHASDETRQQTGHASDETRQQTGHASDETRQQTGHVSDGTRQRLGLAQAALLSALVAGTPVPEGFDRVRIGVQARALAAKRADVVAKVAPELPVILGEEYRPAFLGYAQTQPMTAGYRRDALTFAEHLLTAGRPLDARARRELKDWWLERSGPTPRSGRPVHRLARATRKALLRR
jgi:hypothetical protein